MTTAAVYRLSMCSVRGGASGLPVTVLVKKTPNQYICCFRLILCYNLLPLPSQKTFSVDLHVGYYHFIKEH